MGNWVHKHTWIILLFLASMLVTSCTVESKIGKTFIESPPPITILLFPPQNLYMYNHKGEDIQGFDSLTPVQQDSALYADSKFIRQIDDSTFLTLYVNSFLTELRKLGFTVYLPEAVDSILKEQPQVYVLNMAQLQLDEYNYPFEDDIVLYETRYIKDLDLDAVDFSAWYEISKMNAEKPRKTVLYTTHTMTDGVDGDFFVDPLTENVKYRYRIDSLSIADIRDMASNLGKRHAGYLYDFFLNQYIAYHMPQGVAPYTYFHYNRYTKRLESTEDSGFEVLPNE